tara:strand:- start:516 stop:932 length:417 start_codon:yes stop_codon:yes gene_type:complete
VNNKKNSADEGQPDYDSILDDLYSLQKNLLPSSDNKHEQDKAPAELPEEQSDEDIDSLEIPILTQSLDEEIDSVHQARKVFDEAQHHLFDKADAQSAFDDAKINAIVNKLMVRMRPKMEQLLREKIRAKVIERFNREN